MKQNETKRNIIQYDKISEKVSLRVVLGFMGGQTVSLGYVLGLGEWQNIFLGVSFRPGKGAIGEGQKVSLGLVIGLGKGKKAPWG